LPFSVPSQPGQARSWMGTSGSGETSTGGGAAGDGWRFVGLLEVPLPDCMPPPDPPDGLRVTRGGNGGCGGVGAADWGRRSGTAVDEAPRPADGPATTGVRAGGAVSSVALPATTTIIVGTDVSRTSRAEISSGRRFGENRRWLRTSEDNTAPNGRRQLD